MRRANDRARWARPHADGVLYIAAGFGHIWPGNPLLPPWFITGCSRTTSTSTWW